MRRSHDQRSHSAARERLGHRLSGRTRVSDCSGVDPVLFGHHAPGMMSAVPVAMTRGRQTARARPRAFRWAQIRSRGRPRGRCRAPARAPRGRSPTPGQHRHDRRTARTRADEARIARPGTRRDVAATGNLAESRHRGRRPESQVQP
jgi:hypothetical protein